MRARDRSSNRVPFQCRRCGECCHGAGGIYLQPEQVPAAAAELGLAPQEFAARYLLRRGEAWEVVCDGEGRCALLGPRGCRIHRAKPDICRQWPFFPAILRDPGAFAEAKLACPGIDPRASHEEFLHYYRQMQSEESEGK